MAERAGLNPRQVNHSLAAPGYLLIHESWWGIDNFIPRVCIPSKAVSSDVGDLHTLKMQRRAAPEILTNE
jgi:hypothetical protein